MQVASDASDIPPEEAIGDWVARAAAAAGHDGDCTVSIRIVDEDEMHALNRDFRNQDKSTNVLSFPAGEIDGMPPDAIPILGDLVVCAGVVTREAVEQGKTVADHWSHMVVHGTLHLLGYDHKSAAEAAAMEGLERDILAGLGITDPYRGN